MPSSSSNSTSKMDLWVACKRRALHAHSKNYIKANHITYGIGTHSVTIVRKHTAWPKTHCIGQGQYLVSTRYHHSLVCEPANTLIGHVRLATYALASCIIFLRVCMAD